MPKNSFLDPTELQYEFHNLSFHREVVVNPVGCIYAFLLTEILPNIIERILYTVFCNVNVHKIYVLNSEGSTICSSKRRIKTINKWNQINKLSFRTGTWYSNVNIFSEFQFNNLITWGKFQHRQYYNVRKIDIKVRKFHTIRLTSHTLL